MRERKFTVLRIGGLRRGTRKTLLSSGNLPRYGGNVRKEKKSRGEKKYNPALLTLEQEKQVETKPAGLYTGTGRFGRVPTIREEEKT